MNKALFVKVLGLCLACFCVGGFLVYATLPTNIKTLSGGPFPGATSYTICKIGSTLYAQDQNGYIEFTDTELSDLIEDCRDNFITQAGGTIKILKGNYSYEDTINLAEGAHYVTLEGEGEGTRLQYTGSGDAVYLGVDDAFTYRPSLKNLLIQGTATTDVLVHIVNCIDPIVDKCRLISATNGIGILAEASTGYWSATGTINECPISSCQQAIVLNGQSGKPIHGFTISNAYLNRLDATLSGSVGINITYATYSQSHNIQNMYIQDYELSLEVNGALNNYRSITLEAPNTATYTGVHFGADSGANELFGLRFAGLTTNAVPIDDETALNGQNIYSCYYYNGSRAYLALPQMIYDPDTTNWDDTQAGWIWYMAYDDEIHYWDGTQIMSIDGTPQ